MESPNDQGEENTILQTEQYGLDYYVKELKKIIFDVLFVLLSDEEGEDEDILQMYIETILDYIQMLGFPFNLNVYEVWKADSFLKIIFQIVYMFNITSYMPNISYTAFLISMYMLELIIVLMILDILYVSYSFSRKRFAVMWPLYLLRSGTKLMVTVLFLPITETLTNVFNCNQNSENVLVLYSYPYITCFQGWHFFHTATSLFSILLFVMVSTIVTYAFFEPRMNSGDRTARQHSKAEVSFIMNKVMCQILYNIITSVWQLVIMTFVLSLWLFYTYNYQDPYYDVQVGLFYNVMSAYYLWTNFMLIICQILYNTSFDGGLVAWLIGLPFIATIMILSKKSRIDTLIRSQTKFRSGEQIQDHLRYVLQLIQYQNTDKNAYMLLVGYIEKHKETCLEEDCPLKSKRQRKRNNQNQENVMDEQIKDLIQELDRMFVNGLEKFPDSTKLRLSYAFFLLERMKNKNKAFEQLLKAERGKPAFDEQFIIYRYKKIIKENTDESEENADIVSLIAFDNHIQLCEEYMKLSSNLHKEFWAELREDQPDLGKLNIIGSRISKTVNEAKDNYQKMQKINPNVPQSIKVFGTFTLNILNDKSKGQELIKQAKKIKENFRQEEIQEKKDDFNILNSPFPFLIASAKKQELGVIQNINTLFTTLLGYHKDDIIGKKVSHLMPKFYHSQHEKYMKIFLENFYTNLRNDGQIDSQYLSNDQTNFIKHKNGYIYPISYKVNMKIENMTFYATFKGEATTKTYIYIIVDKNWIIEDISSAAISFLDLEYKTIQSQKIKLTDLIPDIGGVRNEVKFTPKYNESDDELWFKKEITFLKVGKTTKNDDSDAEDKKEHEFDKLRVVKLERIDKENVAYTSLHRKTNTLSNQSSSNPALQINKQTERTQQEKPSKSPSNQSQSLINFDEKPEFEVDQKFLVFMQELYQTPKYEDYKDLFPKSNVDESQEAKHEDFSGNILTRRLINGQIFNIDEEREEEFLQLLAEEEQENSIFGSGADHYDDEDDFRIFNHSNSITLIKKAINTYHDHKNVNKFKLSSTLWILFVIGITILQYIYCVQYLNSHKTDLDILRTINEKLVDLNMIINKVMDLTIIEKGLYGSNFNESFTIQQLHDATSSLIDFDLQMTTPNFHTFQTQYVQPVLFRFYSENLTYSETKISLQSAMMALNSYAVNLSNSDRSTWVMNNSYVQGIMHNFYNSVLDHFLQMSNYLYQDVTNRMNSSEIELIILFAVLLVISSISMFIFINLMFSIKVQRENILFLFLDIPQQHVSRLYRKCEKFMKNYVSMRELLQRTENEGYESSDEEADQEEVLVQEQNEEEEEDLLKQSQKRKKIIQKYRQNKFKGNQGIIIQFLIIALFTFVFAIFNMIQTIQMRMEVQFLLPQFYQNSYLVNVYAQYMNTQKLMLIDYDYKIKGENILTINQQKLSIFTRNTQNLRLFLLSLLTKYYSFRDLYMQLYFGDVCNQLQGQITTQDYQNCYSIIGSNFEMGLASVEQFYLEHYRVNLLTFQNQIQKFSPLLSLPLMQEIENSLFIYYDNAVTYITQFEMEMVFSDTDSTVNIQLLLLIIFIFILVVFFLMFWIPYLKNLNTQINQTIEMLNMIPMNVIKENKSIRRFVKYLIKSMECTVLD